MLEQNDEYIDYIKNEEESILEMILDKEIEAYFQTMFEDVRHERSLILLLSLTDPNILKQSKFTDYEIEIIKNLALEKSHRQNFKRICRCIAVRKGNRIVFSVY